MCDHFVKIEQIHAAICGFREHSCLETGHDLINCLKICIADKSFQRLLVLNIYANEYIDKYTFLNTILGYALNCIELFETKMDGTALYVIELIANLNIKRFFRVKSSEFLRFVKLTEKVNDLVANMILQVAELLSQSNFYDNIEFDNIIIIT